MKTSVAAQSAVGQAHSSQRVPPTKRDTVAMDVERRGSALQHCPCPLIERIFSTRQIELGDGRCHPLDVYIPREEGDLLYRLVRERRPRVTIEVGMANGISTLFMARAHEDNNVGGHHYAIDPFQSTDWEGRGEALVEYAGLSSFVTLIEKPSHQALPELEQQGISAGFVFIDGAHLFDYAISDFLCADRLLETGGLVAFDDSDWPAIRQAIRYVVANRDYQVFDTGTVIEPERFNPGVASRYLRALGKMMPGFGSKLRPDFLVTDRDLRIDGRCVVLQKQGVDSRDSQARVHQEF